MPLEKRYIAYLLRLWRVNSTELSGWQASLEDPHNGKKIGFSNLVRLFSYLEHQTDRDRGSEEAPEDEEV